MARAGFICCRCPYRPHHGKPLRAPENLLTVLPPELAAALFAAARPHRLKADQTLFVAGDPGDGCYRVEQGLLKVSVVSPSGGERILAILGPGALVGEFAMIDAQPRSASVTAARDSELSFISRASFEQVAAAHPDVYRHIVKLLVQRLRDTNNVVAANELPFAQGPVAQRCSASPRRSAMTSAPAASSSARR
jgi:CRP/FNR family transcriptional regulator